VSKAGDKASTAKERSLDKQCSSFMQKICQKYDNVAEVDKLAAVARKVDTVKLVMQENVDQALRNCVQLESIEKAAGACPFSTSSFQTVPRAVFAVSTSVVSLLVWWLLCPCIAGSCLGWGFPPTIPPQLRFHTLKLISDHVFLVTTHAYRGAAAAGGRVQAQRQRAQEQDVVEEHAGKFVVSETSCFCACCVLLCTVLCIRARAHYYLCVEKSVHVVSAVYDVCSV
jgi:hypothetical protein